MPRCMQRGMGAELPEAFSDQMKGNMGAAALLHKKDCPEAVVLIYAPGSDNTMRKRALLAKYVSGRGKLTDGHWPGG